MSVVAEAAISVRDDPIPPFNYEFVIFLLICSILAIFFLNYFNRLFASIASYGIRTWTWHQYRVYFDVSALQISLLGGRIFFTGLRYHGPNETFLVQSGYVTWRYWFRHVREVDILSDGQPADLSTSSVDKNSKLPCRINVDLIGVEWFVYNRGPAYDSILSGLTNSAPPDPEGRSSSSEHNGDQDRSGVRSRVPRRGSNGGQDPLLIPGNHITSLDGGARAENGKSSEGTRPTREHSTSVSGSSDAQETKPKKASDLPFLLQLFPIHVNCRKAAAVIGNQNTKGVLIVKADAVNADIDASETKTVDPYRQTFKVQFEHPVIEMKDNEDYQEDQASRATHPNAGEIQEPHIIDVFFRKAFIFVHIFRRITSCFRPAVLEPSSEEHEMIGRGRTRVPGAKQWQGLSRYLDDQDEDGMTRWSSIEYAADTTVLDSPAATMTIYWDSVGKVTAQAVQQRNASKLSPYINGVDPPAWGMHFSIQGGAISYGPWTDRLRADLQRVFFPGLCKDASPTLPLEVGAWRVPTQFELFVDLEDTIVMRVPFREESKNWRWRGQEPQPKQPNKAKTRSKPKKDNKAEAAPARQAAYLEITVPKDSTVSYLMDMVASTSGYSNSLDLDLRSTELRSTVNNDILWQSGPLKVSCDLSNPLSWNTLRTWQFDINFDDLRLYILRDHVFLLTDLINDWAAGPPADYLTFTPFIYRINLKLAKPKFYLNVNDCNIIDNPTNHDDNGYIILSSPLLTAETSIPIDKYRPEKNVIPFDVKADILDLMFHTPQWNTQATFVKSNELGRVHGLELGGKYHYYTTTSPSNTDTLTLNIYGREPHAYIYGFVIRYILLLKDNYFGDYVHFHTLDEYQDQLQRKELNSTIDQAPVKKSNDTDIILSIKTDNPHVMIPTNIYSSSRYVQAELATVSLDLRITNYIMDMELSLSPVSLSLGSPEIALDSPNVSYSNTQMFIDGARVFGHRLMGLPPAEPTYLCNWDVNVGAVSGELTADFLSALAHGASALALTFDDVENALIPYSSIVFDDVTFARVSVETVNLWLHVDEAAFLVSTDDIDVAFNDWARSHYSKKLEVLVPNLRISCVDAESAARHKSRHHHPVETDAYFQTDIRLGSIKRHLDFFEKRRLQQELLRKEDQRTNRTPFLFIPEHLSEYLPEPTDPPAQCVPMPPAPLLESELGSGSSWKASISRTTPNLARKSSFLSLSDSSVRRSRSRNERAASPKYASQTKIGDSSAKRPWLEPGNRADSPSSSFNSIFSPGGGDSVFEDYQHSSAVAFSSQYLEPHFGLKGIRPDTRETPSQNDSGKGEQEDFLSNTVAELGDIDPNRLDEDHFYDSILVEFPAGLSGFFNPDAIKFATSLLDAILPTDPEDILDSLQSAPMGKISDLLERQDARGSINDILLRLPKADIRFLHSSTLDSSELPQEEQDQYDISIASVALVTRTVKDWGLLTHKEDESSRTSLRLEIGLAEVSAAERMSTLQEPQAAMRVRIDKVLVSVGAKDLTYFDADIGSVVGSTSSGKIEYLASLIHRTGSLAVDLGKLVQSTITRHESRLKYFTYRLLEEGHLTNDPSFLVRPSAVLRSAKGHLRTFDSWKLSMRLRQIWDTMDEDARFQVVDGMCRDVPAVPSDAVDLVITAFQRWRSWDLGNVSEALFLRHIFPALEKGDAEVPHIEYPVLGAFRLAEMQLVLDPGPKENKIALMDLAARLDKKIAGSSELLPEVDCPDGPLIILNLCCQDASIHLNWELCELAEDILRLYNRNQAREMPKMEVTKKETQPKQSSPIGVHVVFEVTKASTHIETINLNAKSVMTGFRTSALFYDNNEESRSISAMIHCETLRSELHNRLQLLGFFHLWDPSVFISHEMLPTEDIPILTVKSMASCQGLQLAIKQDPIGLMEVIDLLLRDEISHLLRVQAQAPSQPKPKQDSKEDVKMADRFSNAKINVAMFLDKYSLSVSLLQSLTYKISGAVARATVAANVGRDLVFDFDIKENSHEMQIDVRNKPKSISLLQIPPTNGRITSQFQQSDHVLTVLSSVQLMHLDASAVYSLLTALNRPQISSAIHDIQAQVKVIQRQITDTFGSDSSGTENSEVEKESSYKMVYNVHLTFEGLQVYTITPLNSAIEPSAQVLFFLDRVHLQASNRHEANGPILKYPELHINLKQIGLDIARGRKDAMRSCGSFGAGITISASSRHGEDGEEDWAFNFKSPELGISLSPETVSTVVAVVGYLREKIKDLDTSRELDYLRKLRQSKPKITIEDRPLEDDDNETDIIESVLGVFVYNFELQNIRAYWLATGENNSNSKDEEDLVLLIKMIEFGTRTKKSARLAIEGFQLQTVPPGQDKQLRSLHSALLPEVIFNIAYVSTANARRMAFQAVGQSLDLRLTPGFIVPAANLIDSILLSAKNVQEAYSDWGETPVEIKKTDEQPAAQQTWNLFGKKRLESLLIDADFAGAVVQVSSKRSFSNTARSSKLSRPSLAGKYGQFNADDTGSGAELRTPGLAWKIELRDNGHDDPILSGEIKINASSNILYPSVVPLIMDMVSSVKEVVANDGDDSAPSTPNTVTPKSQKSGDEENILTTDPSAVLGRVQLNLGLRICRQEFSLSCQPIARVAAMACFDNIYFTANTVNSLEQGNFFAISGTFTNLQASVQHVYSRESTGSFDLETITLSFMNSKHVSGTSGVSAILNVSPMRISVNARQVQDFLLFREIWYPEDLRKGDGLEVAKLATETSQGHLVQRYQQVAATAAFPWTATISIAALDVSVDMGQSIGKSVFEIKDFWVSSKKTSDWEQNLCLGFRKIGIDCTGRLSGFITLQDFKLRTLIHWPNRAEALNSTPLVQASLGFNTLRLKVAFDYQAFLVADITSLEFLMYNVRENGGDRLVAMLEGDAVQVFGTTTSSAQFVSLYRAFKRFVQERKANFESSLEEIEKFMKRKTSVGRFTSQTSDREPPPKVPKEDTLSKSPISLDTDVVVALKALNLGLFPSTFSDNQLFKIEALNASARFAASFEDRRIHSLLKLTLGQLRIGLAGVRSSEAPKTLNELSVNDVVQRATGSRGGTILKVPQVSAVMETWQKPNSNSIDYVFKSAFEGKVEVGWNYSRVSYIRGMWAKHSKALEQTWGRELPMAAVKITGVPEGEGEDKDGEQLKITAEVNVPQSKYTYQALEPPIIETPQLRDMGEATPPLEWIGLHRDRLPNLTHQILIVSLLELAGEVEDAYSRILGAS
ncbi:unnamed protein product [Clonostachys solani]|uniref:Protein CSF1 n=1 Tax=Clonostachys solani TaxID=160281 RepID=A0A9N9W2C8_9HYPO|nr:unnamed protein product [Clonostachys solani]